MASNIYTIHTRRIYTSPSLRGAGSVHHSIRPLFVRVIALSGARRPFFKPVNSILCDESHVRHCNSSRRGDSDFRNPPAVFSLQLECFPDNCATIKLDRGDVLELEQIIIVEFKGVCLRVSDNGESRPSKPKRWGILITMVIAGIVVVAIAGYFYSISNRGSNDDLPTTLHVSGEVNPGADRIPVSLLFEDEASGETENVSFEGTHYEIDLPNGNYDWQITVLWHGETNGQCDGGNLAYQRMNTATITHDVSCQN